MREPATRLRGLAELCGALLPPERGGPDPLRLASDLEAFLRAAPPATRLAARAAALSVTGAARSRFGRLGAMSPDARAAALHRLSHWPATGHALHMLRTLILFVAGAERESATLLERGRRLRPNPDPPLDVTPAREWPTRTVWDVVVIGSGAGGAMAARTLARAGLRTVMVEEGRAFSVNDFRTGAPLRRFAALYRDAGSTVAIGRPPVLLPVGRGVGGTTLVNSGTCYRTPERVLRTWRDRAGFGLADPDRFSPYLDEVWATLGVAPVGADVMGRNGELALAGAATLGWGAGPLMHNANGCAGCCQSAIGCPGNRKSSVNLNALPEACAAGLRIVTEARAERIVHARGRALGVLARRRDGTVVSLVAPRVVVAAGATETPPLLRRSGLTHPQLGRNLSIHPAITAMGRFDEPVRSSEGVLQSAGIEEFHEREGILIEATTAPRGMGWSALPGYGPSLVRALDASDHLASLGALIADGPAGRVLGRRRAIVRYDLLPADRRRLLRALELVGRALFAAGAVEVITALPDAGSVRSPAELAGRVASADARDLHVAAFHPGSTARAGADASRFPVAPDGRLRGVDGVWIADASILPSCATVNPQVTIMAMALAVADGIVARA